jgi:hypothetical protein
MTQPIHQTNASGRRQNGRRSAVRKTAFLLMTLVTTDVSAQQGEINILIMDSDSETLHLMARSGAQEFSDDKERAPLDSTWQSSYRLRAVAPDGRPLLAQLHSGGELGPAFPGSS